MIDAHCHLAGIEFADDLEAVVGRARAAGILRCLVIVAAEDEDEIERATRVKSTWPDVRFAIGVHPHNAHKFADDGEVAAGLVESRLEQLPDICAIGEIGLDYHYDSSPPVIQDAVFRAQLRLARRIGFPVVIHTREAEEDTLRLITEESGGELTGVFHCFSGNRESAGRALQTGFHVSIPGIATFPKADELREAARVVPPDRLLMETDSPYLAPVPHRGKRNEPAYVTHVLDTLAEIRHADRHTLAATLVANFDRLFSIPAKLSASTS